MKQFLVSFFALSVLVPSALGQAVSWQQVQRMQTVSGIVSNQVQVLSPAGDSLWMGPGLTVYDDARSDTLFRSTDATVEQRLRERENVVFSLATEPGTGSGATIWAGLAFDAGGEAAGAGGFLVSTDGGHSFESRSHHLDRSADTTVEYGASTLPAVPITREADSAPQDLALHSGAQEVWVAGARSGLRRSADRGETWERMVLPPDSRSRIDPDSTYDFTVAPPLEDGRGYQNHVAFSVLVDETETVWAGTAAGLNRSTPDDVRASGGRAWQRFDVEEGTNSLTGRGIVAIAEQPRDNRRNPIWVASWALGDGTEGQRFGVTMTPDGGETFRQVLVGERVYDVAARPNRVYAAAEAGLFVSGDQGNTWRSIKEVQLQNDDQGFPSDFTTRAVAVTPSALWVGTTEGLLRLSRAEESRLLRDDPEVAPPRWRLFRTNVPVNPEEPTEEVPDVETYAYPNPFVPSQHGRVRIVYELSEPHTVEVNIYDFAMNHVRTLREQKSAGQKETLWDGTDKAGLRLPTGTYLYTVDIGGQSVRGKIVLAE